MELESNVVVDTQQQQQQQQQQQKQKQKQKHVHVLAVDDNLIDRKLLEKLLKVSSYQVTCVDSGDKALEYLGLLDSLDINNNNNNSSSPSFDSQSSKQEMQMQGLKVNMIMTDFCMPGMTGYDLLKRVKGSSWKDVPVVVMSSENVPSRINMCLEGGAEEFLLKPVQLSDLEKLQPCLLKSCGHQCDKIENGFDNHHDNENNDINNNNNNNSSNSASKRKAMSPEPVERTPKTKGLAVV